LDSVFLFKEGGAMFRQPNSTPARYQDMRPHKIPEPPLNPYMQFSRKFWHKARQENAERPLWEISRIVGQMWKDLSEAERNEYQLRYEHEKLEYEKIMKSQNFNTTQMAMQKRSQKQVGSGNRRQEPTNPGVVIQPVIDEDPFEITPKRLAAMRFERNQRLCLELFNGQPMPEVRTFVAPQRIESLRKQGDNLDNHKRRITEEMVRAEENFKQRKRAIEEDSEKFEIALKKACDMRPKVDIDFYNNMVEEASKKLLEQWEAYQKRQEALNLQKEAEQKSTPILYSLTVSPNTENKKTNGDVNATIPEDTQEQAMEIETSNHAPESESATTTEPETAAEPTEETNDTHPKVNGINETTLDSTAASEENNEIPMETSNDASETQQQQNENNVS
jgi:hypothetical protein